MPEMRSNSPIVGPTRVHVFLPLAPPDVDGAFLLQQVNSVSTITLARQMRR